MSVYTPQSLGIKPPPGGFLQGGWYDSRQYWNGTLSEPGQIHVSSNQVGAGQNVSQEVNQQTSVAAGLTPNANQEYIDAQRRAAAANPVAPVNTNFSSAGTTGSAGATGAGVGLGATPTLNLPDIYKNLQSNSGISELENQYSDMEKSYIEAKGKVNDNPFLSEATRVGRVAKLESLFNERTANIKSDIATRKADIETQLNLQMKQFDINSQVAKQALDQFNTLLSMGALDNASGEDIANITRSTGISSQAIQSAIDAQKKKNVKASVHTSTDDAGVVTAYTINEETGEIINKVSLGAIGNAQTGTADKSSAAEQKTSVELDVLSYLSDEGKQASVSPENLYTILLNNYPDAIEYIKANWSPTQIRVANGEAKPYGRTPGL